MPVLRSPGTPCPGPGRVATAVHLAWSAARGAAATDPGDADDVRLALDSAEEAPALEAAIVKLERVSPRAADVVEPRDVAGLSIEQSATTQGFGHRTADREWQFARACVHAEDTRFARK